MVETVKSYCRVCQAYCGYEVLVDAGRIVRLRSDIDDPVSEGYACFKGLRHADLYASAARLTHTQARRGGAFAPLASEQALEEIGRRLGEIVARHGPASVGFFIGTQALFNSTAPPMIDAFAKALPTPRVFTTMTIDQSAKWIGEARLGAWAAGPQMFDEADVWMFVGSNPLVSMVAGAGASQFAFTNPVKRLARAKARGMKVIVIDPRVTETAREADLHLRIKPGYDAMLAAALIQVIVAEGWHDVDFCDAYVDHLEALRTAVAAFTPEACADHVGVPAAAIRQAARMFAHEAGSGMVGTGTGPDMARHSNTAEHLYQAINVLCGRFPRAGDKASNRRLLRPPAAPTADVSLPAREWETGPSSLSRGLGRLKGVMMSAEIADEITHPSPQRMRALICVGGNLAVALPDQRKAERSLSLLELLVVVDPVMTATARLADYVVAPKLPYERADHTGSLEGLHQTPLRHITAPVVDPPEGSDVVDDWYALWRIATAAGLDLTFHGEALSSETPPTTEHLLELMARGSATPYDDRAAGTGACHVDTEAPTIGARLSETRFALLPADVARELESIRLEMLQSRAPEPHFQLVVRRHKETMNSTGVAIAATRKRYPHNPVYLHPDDLIALGLSPGDLLLIRRGDASVGGFAKADDSLRRGTVAMSHGWSGRPTHPWEATNALVDVYDGAQAINGMPVMTGFEVEVLPVA